MENDKRCPCNLCIIQTMCTEYCTKFHHYRRLVLSEVDVYISQIIDEYDRTKPRGMSSIWHDLRTAYIKYVEYKTCAVFEYAYIVDKLSFLENRFDVIVANGYKVKRGSAMAHVMIVEK